MEKAGSIGDHNLSGAIMDPSAIKQLFPDMDPAEIPSARAVGKERIYYLTGSRAIPVPIPPFLHNKGNLIVSMSEVARWLAKQAEAAGVMVFPSFPAAALLREGDAVVGVRTADRNAATDGAPKSNYEPGMDLRAKVTVLAEGVRGRLARAYQSWQGISSESPQIYSIGVKELWEVPSAPTSVVHTLGFPLDYRMFGGSFMYPLSDTLLALGVVVGLDHPSASFDPHGLLQKMKTHPFFGRCSRGGRGSSGGQRRYPREAIRRCRRGSPARASWCWETARAS
jgi:electron-transferring-flavoprotein dehydrogenase